MHASRQQTLEWVLFFKSIFPASDITSAKPFGPRQTMDATMFPLYESPFLQDLTNSSSIFNVSAGNVQTRTPITKEALTRAQAGLNRLVDNPIHAQAW